MSWEKIEDHLFHRYDVEGEDKELSNLMEEHDKQVKAKAIDEFAERMHELCGYEENGFQYPYLLHESRIDEIVEQMKKEV